MDRNLIKNIHKDIGKPTPLKFLLRLLKLIVQGYEKGEMFVLDKDSEIRYILILSALNDKEYIINFENTKTFKSIGVLPAKKLLNLLSLFPKTIKGIPAALAEARTSFGTTATQIPATHVAGGEIWIGVN